MDPSRHADPLEEALSHGSQRVAQLASPAAAAMRKCEDRLHALHAYGMARYDRLRADGISPLDAMRQAAPLFVHSPDPRVGDPAATRPALTSAGEDDSYPLAEHAPGDLAAPGPGAIE